MIPRALKRKRMNAKPSLLLSLLVAAGLLLPHQADLNAQVAVGAHASVSEISRTAFGLGGRVAVILRQAPELTLALEGVGEYLWPSCDVVDCGAALFHANLLARRRVASYAEAYAGIGFVYEKYTLQDSINKLKGDDVGVSVLAGTQSGQPGGLRPFLEVRATFMNDLDNQFGAALGLRVPLG
jgi:hypothetical protein